MVDIRLNKEGLIERIRTVDQKALNLLNTSVGSINYYPSFGFNYRQYIQIKESINLSNIQVDLANYLLQNNVQMVDITKVMNDFTLTLTTSVTNGGFNGV